MRPVKLLAAVLLASAVSVPAASADPWPLCVGEPVVSGACLPICFGTHDNWQCIPDV